MKYVEEMDKASGFEGTIFGGAIIGPVVQVNQREGDIKIGPYGLGWRNNKYTEFVDFEVQKEESEKLINKILSGNMKIQYFKDFTIKIKKWIKVLKKYKERVLPNIADLSDKEFLEEFNNFIKEYAHYFGLAAFSFAFESYIAKTLSEETSFIEDADEYIFKYIDEMNKDFKSFMILYEEEVQKLSNNKIIMQELLERFYYVKANYFDSLPLSEEQVKEDLKVLKKKKVNHRKISKDELDTFLSRLNKRQRVMLDILAHTLPVRDLRKEINQIGQYTTTRFFDEALKRRNVEDKRSLYLKMNLPEMKELLGAPVKLGEKLREREEVTWHVKNEEIHFYEYYAIKEREVEHTDILKGVVASKGRARSRVRGTSRVIIGPSEFKMFKKGEILVVEATRPDFVPVMKIAKAIIAEEGGITSHAAIVSRELGIPCLVGVNHATKIINNGDFIDMDMDKGLVRTIK